jgi:DNA polymerase-1
MDDKLSLVAIDIETSSPSGLKSDNLNPFRNKIECVGIAGKNSSVVDCDTEAYRFIPESNTCYVFHNAGFDLKVLAHHSHLTYQEILGIHIFDTYVAARLLHEEERCGLKELVKVYFGKDRSNDTYKIKSLGTRNEFLSYCSRDAEDTLALQPLLLAELKKQELMPLFDLEMEVIKVMMQGELTGIPLDFVKANSLKDRFTSNSDKILTLMKMKYTLPEDFNVNSTKQLKELLYGSMKCPVLKYTSNAKTKQVTTTPSTDNETLLLLDKKGYRIASWIIAYRKWIKLAQYPVRFLEEADFSTIHAKHNTVGTETGRFTGDLQQVPAKNASGLNIRKLFVGNLIVADADNVELRLLAHFSQDPILMRNAINGVDMHQHTADRFGITRSQAKIINFAIMYGRGPKALGEALGMTMEEAKQLLNDWFSYYKGVSAWKEKTVYEASKRGYVTSLSGRRRHVPTFIGWKDFKRRTKQELAEGYSTERQIINFIMQGSSADITKKAIVLLKDMPPAIQVHDELVWVNPTRSVDEIKTVLDSAVRLKVPISWTVQGVPNWAMAKDKVTKVKIAQTVL